MIKDFTHQTALITGAASGLGLECAKRAAELGMHLLLVDVNAKALEAACQEIIPLTKALGSSCHFFVCDVSDPSAMRSLGEQVVKEHKVPHLVMNNAGIASGGLIWEHTAQEWDRVLRVNVWGVINGVTVFTPLMLAAAQKDPHWRGHIINTASMAGLLTPPNMGIYNVSKHAVVALTETLYQDLRLVSSQLSASVLCPYFVPTAINQSFDDALGSATQSQIISKQMLDKAVVSGKVSARDVALKVFDALELDQFYIFSHPQALGNVQKRMQAILDNTQPPDPFALRPEIGWELREALKANPNS